MAREREVATASGEFDRDALLASIEEGSAYLRLRPLVEQRPEEPRDILLRSQIFCPPIAEQDDIYEGRPRFTWRMQPTTGAEIRMLFERRNAQVLNPLPDIDWFIGHAIKQLSDPVYMAKVRADFEEEIARVYASSSILSFFKDPRVQSYWANYAARGRGYGLIFQFRGMPWPMETAPRVTLPAVPLSVRYVDPDARPAIELSFAPADPARGFDDIQAGLLSKSDEWSEQREERLIRIGVPASNAAFPGESLKALILGYGLSDQDRATLIEIAELRVNHVPVFEVLRSGTGYRLDINQVA